MSEQSLLMQACETHERRAEGFLDAIDRSVDKSLGANIADVGMFQVAALAARAHTALAAHYFDREMRDGR